MTTYNWRRSSSIIDDLSNDTIFDKLSECEEWIMSFENKCEYNIKDKRGNHEKFDVSNNKKIKYGTDWFFDNQLKYFKEFLNKHNNYGNTDI